MSPWRFGRLFFFSPSKAAEESRRPEALRAGLILYGLTLLAAAVFHWLRPFDFPDANAAYPEEHQGLGFWLRAMLWQPPLMAALVAFAGTLLAWMRQGWLPLKVFSSLLWCAAPLLLVALYAPDPPILPLTALRAALLAWAAATAFLIRRLFPRGAWRPLAAFLLGLNVVELASFLPQAAVTAVRSEPGYKAVVAIAGFWMLGSGALGLKRLEGDRPLPRALLPLVFALVLQIAVVVAAFTAGWLPKDTLKALLYG